MSAPYLVTGVATQDVYPRLEIRDLHENHPKQFTLFVRGWQEIRRRDYRPIAAQYEQIAGIHGMPYVPWPGDPDEAVQTVRGAWLGYCNHASIMFPTWHRPCIMLLEQAISEAAHGIAGTYAKRHPGEADEWINAARELRFPYWDWTDKATGQEGLPKILTDHKISIHVPDGKTEEVENVLAFYKFNNQIDGFNDRLEYKNIYEARRKDPNKKPDTMAYFKQWDRTYRWPNSSPVDVTEDIQALNDELKAQGVPFPVGSWANLRSDVASLFGYPIDVRPELHANVWDQFSNTRFQSSRPDVDHEKKNHSPFKWEHCASIEQPHNNVHLVVGGIGHMCDNDTAAYDPIFYLHHCNVDRLLAFWEHIYPNYVAGTEGYLDVDGVTRNPFTQVDGTFIEMGTQSVDGETPLMPFRKSDYTYWTSKDTHSLHDDQENPTVNKYYTYGPIAGVELELDPKKAPNEKKRERQRAAIQKYFGFDPVKAVKDAEVTVKQRIFAQQAPFGAPAPALAGRIIQVVDNYRHFVIATSLSQSHITGSYMLKIYMAIGEQEFHVGSVAALGRGKSTGCGNCQARRAAGTRVQGVVTLPHAAIAGLLQTLAHHTEKTEDQEVLISIKGSIRARIVLPSGKVHSEPTGQVSNSSGLDFLEKEARPSLRLYSSDVYQTYEEGQQPEASESSEAPFNFQDWKDHDSIVLGHWVKKEVD